jgi:uncharacterized protein YcfL
MWFNKVPFLFIVFLLLSCTTSADSQEININNNHSTTIMVDIWDIESSNTVDPAPAFPINATNISAIPIKPTESYTLPNREIKGNSDAKNLRLFLYEVEGDSAFFKAAIRFSRSQAINIRHGSDGFYIDS